MNGRKVLLIVCGFFGVIFAVNGVFMHYAFSTFGGIDAAGAYRANFLLTRNIVAAERQNRLGWKVEGSVSRNSDNTALVEIKARYADGAPVEIKSIDVEMRRPADERQDGTVKIERKGAGEYSGTATHIGPGQWEFVVTLFDTKGERFLSRNRLILK
ncbi:MAG: FixH family protein [Beijerinckiaceae bacterium]